MIFKESTVFNIISKWILSLILAIIAVGVIEGEKSLVIHVILANVVFFFLPPHPIPLFSTNTREQETK